MIGDQSTVCLKSAKMEKMSTSHEASMEDEYREPNSTFRRVYAALNKACRLMSDDFRNVRGTLMNSRENVQTLIQNACAELRLQEGMLAADNTSAPRLDRIEEQITELKNTIKETAIAKTYAQATSSTMASTETEVKTKQQELRQQREKWKMEKAKFEVTLSISNATEETKKILATKSHKEITEQCQTAIEQANIKNIGTTKLNGVNKLPNHLRIQYKTEEQAKLLQEMDWNKVFNGTTLHRPKYGVVIHGVPKAKVNLAIKTTITQLQQENEEIPITNIAPLRRKPREDTTHQSIVVFTEDTTAANKYIKQGFYIENERFPTERYCPQVQITQCFKCHNYDHRAIHCKREQTCGKCTENHATDKYTNTKIKCSQCGGNHEAWRFECPARIAESKRLQAVKRTSSYLFTT
jgi:hypothetical protein